MIFIGDCHGKTSQLIWMLKHNPNIAGKQSFQLGDMGVGFKGVNLPEKDRSELLFIRGNHDNPQMCQRHPNYAGEYGFLTDQNIFFLGGAWSIDWQWRQEGVSWWRDEEQSLEELNKAKALFIETKPRIMATHEAPSHAAFRMLNDLIIPRSSEDNPTNVKKGADYSYYKSKSGCVDTRTSHVLQEMLNEHQPEHWVFGHYHVTRDFDHMNTHFHCLAELDYKEII